MAERSEPNLTPNRPEPVMMAGATDQGSRSTAAEVADELTERWERIVQRFAEPWGSPHPSLREHLRDDMEFAAIRLRYYHRYYPVQFLGAVAASAFVLGAVLGLGRE
jgi:hypothetical protein